MARTKQGAARGAGRAAASQLLVSARALLVGATSIAIAIVLAVSAAGVTYALLNSSTSTGSNATITSGTAALAVSSPLVLPTTPMYPGLTVYGSARLTNTGDVPLTVAVTGLTGPAISTTFSQALTVGTASAASESECASGRVTSAWATGTFAAPSTSTVGAALAKSATTVVCVSLTLSSTVAPGAQGQAANNFTLVLNGTQAG